MTRSCVASLVSLALALFVFAGCGGDEPDLFLMQIAGQRVTLQVNQSHVVTLRLNSPVKTDRALIDIDNPVPANLTFLPPEIVSLKTGEDSQDVEVTAQAATTGFVEVTFKLRNGNSQTWSAKVDPIN